MKATLEFELPNEDMEHHAALHGLAYRKALSEIRQMIRGKIKHGHEFKTPTQALEWAMQVVIDECEDAELDQGLP